MPQKERWILSIIFKHFIESITPKFNKPQMVGQDFHGTKYFEVPLHSTSSRKRPSRYFVPKRENDFQQEIPAEWEAWLRHRRPVPPSEEEVLSNHQLALEKSRKGLELTSGANEDLAKLPEAKEKKVNTFPAYEEYKNHGQDFKPKHYYEKVD